jgi:flagellar biogenesis protein FliO
MLALALVGVLDWLVKRLEKGKQATDAESDPSLLRRAGRRIRERLRSEDDPRF